jgi:hypothetical protein
MTLPRGGFVRNFRLRRPRDKKISVGCNLHAMVSSMGLWDPLYDDGVLRTEEVAAILGIPIWTVRRLARQGLLTAKREYSFGGVWFFDASAVRTLQKKRRYVWKGFAPEVSPYRKRVLRRESSDG